MHSSADTNARLSRLLAGEQHEAVARAGLENLEAFKPLRFEAPPSWLASAIDQARVLGRDGNTQAARQIVANAAAEKHTAVDLGKFREHVTWVEAQNASKLTALAWMWATLMPHARKDAALDKQLELLELFARDHFDVEELRTDRGWAESQTKAHALLPNAWRAA